MGGGSSTSISFSAAPVVYFSPNTSYHPCRSHSNYLN